MAKVTKHGGPTQNHFGWVPIVRPQLGAIDQCHGGSSTTSIPKLPIESEQSEQPPSLPASTMENPSLPTETYANVDSVALSIQETDEPPIEEVKPKKRSTRRKKSDDFDF